MIARWGSLDDAPGVEPPHQLVERALDVLHEFVDEGPVVLVSHDAVLHAMLEDIDPALIEALDPGSWTTVGRGLDGRMVVLSVNNH